MVVMVFQMDEKRARKSKREPKILKMELTGFKIELQKTKIGPKASKMELQR